MLLARWLGAEDYGNMMFLIGMFVGLNQLLDLGSSTAFFTFLSQKSRSYYFILAFFVWTGIRFLIPAVIIILILPNALIYIIWQGNSLQLVMLAFASTFSQLTLWPLIIQLGESQRKTIKVQLLNLITGLVHLLGIILLQNLNILELNLVFYLIITEYLIISYLGYRGYKYDVATKSLTYQKFKTTLTEYFLYCKPLVPYVAVGFFYEITDRWLLQNYAGSKEQAFYNVSLQISAIGLLTAASVSKIFWKEVAEFDFAGDRKKTAELFKKTTLLVYSFAAVCSGFYLPWIDEIILVLLGPSFTAAYYTMLVMALFVLHQSIGQTCLTYFYATEQSSLASKMGIGFMFISMAVTYLMLAPSDNLIPGLNLNSFGLAIKMFVMQLIYVNLMLFVVSRQLGYAFTIFHQVSIALIFIFLGFLVREFSLFLFYERISTIFIILFSAIIYCAFSLIIFYKFPLWLVAVDPEDMKVRIRPILRLINRRYEN